MTINRLVSFDPTIAAGTGFIETKLVGTKGTILFLNQSLVTFTLKDDSGLLLAIVPALWALSVAIKYPSPRITWKMVSYPNASTDGSLKTVDASSYSAEENVSALYSGPLGGSAIALSSLTASSIDNEGNAAGALFIESKMLGQTSPSIQITNDGVGWIAVLLGGVLTKVIQLANSGNPVQLGAVAQIVEVLGNFLVDGNETITGTLGVTGATTLAALAATTISSSAAATLNSAVITNGVTVGTTLGVTGASTLNSLAVTNAATVGNTLTVTNVVHGLQSGNFDGNSAFGGTLSVAGALTLNGAGTGLTVTNDALVSHNLDVTNIIHGHQSVNADGASTFASTLTVTSTLTANGALTANSVINLNTGTLRSLTSGAGTGNGTSNTNITNPTAIVFDPCTLSGSSQTIGGTTTSTTTITTGAALAWRYIAYLQ
jgi:hypothetical protein